jgi:hypothetical protein
MFTRLRVNRTCPALHQCCKSLQCNVLNVNKSAGLLTGATSDRGWFLPPPCLRRPHIAAERSAAPAARAHEVQWLRADAALHSDERPTVGATGAAGKLLRLPVPLGMGEAIGVPPVAPRAAHVVASGSVNQKVAPRPGTLVTPTLPPCSRTISRPM